MLLNKADMAKYLRMTILLMAGATWHKLYVDGHWIARMVVLFVAIALSDLLEKVKHD